jgi:soluble lytic murein transglycosylase-like protein
VRSGRRRLAAEDGQSLLLLLAAVAVLAFGVLALGAFGQALGAKGRHQRAADLAAVSAAAAMREAYPRLFEPAELAPGVPNPRHLTRAAYLDLARRAAVAAARRNGVAIEPGDVDFPERDSFAPVRVRVRVTGEGTVRIPGDPPRRRRSLPVRAEAVAELVPPTGALTLPELATGGGYRGPLAYRQGKPMRPDVALAFDRLAAAARREAGLSLIITSAYRSDAEQAELFRRNPNPRWVAPPGRSLHRLGTELDLGPPAAYGWLARNAKRFGFIRRYSWEPWHYGYSRSPGSASVGYARRSADGRSAVPDFVPAAFREPIARAAQRWNVGAALLAAQLYAESNFNPFARSRAGALGIAQFMPGTARAYGLRNPFDPVAAIDAQAHYLRDLLRRFGSVPLALAAYNAGPTRVARCGCIPPYAETRAYVAKILGLLSGAGEAGALGGLEVRLVE